MVDDPYSILEVSRHATDEEIERAYGRLDSVRGHPRGRSEGHKRDVVDVWIDDGPTVSIHTPAREADALSDYVERAAASDR